MTEQELKDINPWKEVADLYMQNTKECLFSEHNRYYCKNDKDAIDEYNAKVGPNDKIITSIPAEPWWGNPLTAKLIILSLNPGYVEEVNMTLGKLIQSNEGVAKKLIEYKKQTLLFNVDSFLPREEIAEPVSCKDAVNMLGDWYWYKMLRHLKEEVMKEKDLTNEDDFFRDIAMIEYCGYSSKTAKYTLPKSEKGSHGFLIELMRFLSKRDIRFLIMRDAPRWEMLLKKVGCEKEKILRLKERSRSQSITRGNLRNDHFDKIKDFLVKG